MKTKMKTKMKSIVKMNLRVIILLITATTIAQSKDVYLLIGQSNMAGRPEIEGATEKIKNVAILHSSGKFVYAKNPLNKYSTIRKDLKGQRLSPAYSFSKKMVEHTKDSIRIIVQARGGTRIAKFMKGSDWGYYEATLNRVKNALERYPDLNLKAVLVHQGESDRKKSKAYLKSVQHMIEAFRKDLKMKELPFIFGEIGAWNPDYKKIRKEMKKIPEIIPYTYLVSSDELTNLDKHHFDRKSILELGERYAEKCIEVLYKSK